MLTHLANLATTLSPLPIGITVGDGQSNSFVVYGSALAAVVSTLWAILERSERRTLHQQNSALSDACRQLVDQHYRERLQAEERHLLTHDSSMRNVLEHLERALRGKPSR